LDIASRLGGEPFEIVGVAAEGFGGLSNRLQSFTSVWVPMSSTTMFPSQAAPPENPSDRRRRQLAVFGVLQRFRPRFDGISQAITAASVNLDAAFPIEMQQTAASDPAMVPRRWSVRTLADVNEELDGQFLKFEAVVTAIVGLVLVVACTNLANLILARGSSRSHELAVRRALGASRVQLVLEQMAESWMLGAMGSVGAIIVIRVLLNWFSGASLPIGEGAVIQLDPRLDWTTLGLAAASMVASLLVFGLAPAIQLTRVQVRPALSAEGGSTGLLRWRTRRTLIAVQVMISLSFFLMAGLCCRDRAIATWTADGRRCRSSGHRPAEFSVAAVERTTRARSDRPVDDGGGDATGIGCGGGVVRHAVRHQLHAAR
jgi:hypothetical protein